MYLHEGLFSCTFLYFHEIHRVVVPLRSERILTGICYTAIKNTLFFTLCDIFFDVLIFIHIECLFTCNLCHMTPQVSISLVAISIFVNFSSYLIKYNNATYAFFEVTDSLSSFAKKVYFVLECNLW